MDTESSTRLASRLATELARSPGRYQGVIGPARRPRRLGSAYGILHHVKSLDDVRHRLLQGDLEAPLGLEECVWLDAKKSPYFLDQERHKNELAKDVSGFANTPQGACSSSGMPPRSNMKRRSSPRWCQCRAAS